MRRAATVVLSALGAAAVAGAGFYAGRHLPMHGEAAGAASHAATEPASAAGKKILYWHDPMVPGQRFDKPGKSPFMDMQLVPVYADAGAEGGADGGGVRISPAVEHNLGMRLATVRKAVQTASFDAVGTVQFDERRNVAVQTRVAGYVERLSVRAPMERVRKGQALATVFAPEWLGPQNELLALQRAGVSQELVAAARERLRALSIPESLVRQSEAAGTAQARFTLSAPADGVVAELGVREGVAVAPGTTLFRIAGLDTVWAVAEVPEAQAVRIARGQPVEAVLQADASQTFSGKLTELLPQVSASTRTLQARFEVDNHAGRLTPGMLLRLRVDGPSAERLVVLSEAVIRTGRRALVLVRRDGGAIESREVVPGQEFGDDIEIVRGLAEGEQVVASGQFLIDSEAQLRSATGAMAPAASASASAASAADKEASAVYEGSGTVESVDADGITISHGAIAALRWPAMTMGFGKPATASFPGIRPGDAVRFTFRKGGATDYELVSVQRVGGGR